MTKYIFNFFSKRSIGLDIADRTIEAVELIKKSTKIKVLSKGRCLLGQGIVQNGRIKDEKRLMEAVKKVFLDAKPYPIIAKKLIFSLPESQTYFHIFKTGGNNKKSFKKLTIKEKDDIIFSEARKNIPLKDNNLLFSYKPLEKEARSFFYSKNNNKSSEAEYLIVAASKEVVSMWQKFFQKLEIEANIFDIESIAVFRSLFIKPPKKMVCIVDIGSTTTNMAVFNKGALYASYTINTAGNIFTEEIAKNLKIELNEAEKAKKQYGLSEKNNRIFSTLVKLLKQVSEEIRTLIDYSQGKTGRQVEEIILIGGSSKLKGIFDYFDANFDVPIIAGRSYLCGRKESLEYIKAIGLALRGIGGKNIKKDPAISIKKPKKKNIIELFFKFCKRKKMSHISRPLPTTGNSQLAADTSRVRKLRVKKYALVIIVFIGIIIVGLAYLYKDYKKTKDLENRQAEIVQYTKTQSFVFKIPVAANSIEYTSDRVKGRIVENIIKVAGDYNEAVARSRILAEKELLTEERMWLTPVNSLMNQESADFPWTIKWVVYFEKDANRLFLKEVDILNKNNISYVLNNIEKETLDLTENPNIFYLTGKITVSLNQLIKIENEAEGTDTSQETGIDEIVEVAEFATGTIGMAIIKETGTGWLRVREGSGTIYPEVTKVYPGESYPLLEEK